MRSEAGMARQGKLKRHDGSEANAMAAKMSVKASLLSLHDKRYPYLTAFVKRSWRKNTCTPNSRSQYSTSRFITGLRL